MVEVHPINGAELQDALLLQLSTIYSSHAFGKIFYAHVNFMFTSGCMEKHSLFNVGYWWSRVSEISMEYILHKYRGTV